MAYRVELEERLAGQFLWKIVDENGVSHASSISYPTKEAAAKVACMMAIALGAELKGWNPAEGGCCSGATDATP
jgi:hypothetical protein